MSDESPPEPKFTAPFRVKDVPWEQTSHGERFGTRWRAVGAFGGASHIGVAVEELAPGKQSNPAHFHMLEEEQMWILEGRATLRLGDKTYEMSAGDYVVFPAGQIAGHCLINKSNSVCRFLIIGERNPNDVIVYPDSDKVRVRALDENYQRSARMDYWDGEDDT